MVHLFIFLSRSKRDRLGTLTFRAQCRILCARSNMENEMNISVSRIVVVGLLLLFTLASGVWLSNSGKPYNTVIFTLHKLITLGTIIFIVATVGQLRPSVDIQALTIGAIAITGLLFLTQLVSGALLSLNIHLSGTALRIHQVASLLASIFSTATMYLVVSSRP